MPQYIKPFGFILIRVALTTTLFFILHRFWIKEKVEKKDFLLLAACGLFGVVINQELFFLGLSITNPINASLIMIMTPLLVFIISFFMARESVTWQKILGLILGSAGALIILGGKGFSFNSHTVWGDFFVLINATSYAIYLVMVRPLMKKYHPLTVIKWVFFFGLIPVFFFGVKQFGQIEWSGFTPKIWLCVAFVVICVTFFAYLLNILALREVHSSVVGAYIYLQPGALQSLLSQFIPNNRSADISQQDKRSKLKDYFGARDSVRKFDIVSQAMTFFETQQLLTKYTENLKSPSV